MPSRPWPGSTRSSRPPAPARRWCIIIFELEVSSSDAAQDVRDKIAQIEALFPDNADDPTILRFDPAELPVMSVGISSERLRDRRSHHASPKTSSPSGSPISAASAAPAWSAAGPREVHVDIDPDRLTALSRRASPRSPARWRPRTRTCRPARSPTRPAPPRCRSRAGSPTIRAFEDVIVTRRAGQPIRLGDIAIVERPARRGHVAGDDRRHAARSPSTSSRRKAPTPSRWPSGSAR